MTGKRWYILSLILLLVFFITTAITAKDYGITWDEEYRKEYGVVLLNFYSSLGTDQEALSKWNLYYYGGFFDTIAQLATKLSPYGVYETRHVANLIFGWIGVIAVFGLGWHIEGAAGGFFSALFLILTPVYYGHMFANPKDIPFAALFALSLFAICSSISLLPRLSKKQIVSTGVAIGLAMGARVAGVALLGCLALLWGGWAMGRYWAKKIPLHQVLADVCVICAIFISVVAIAWGVMLVCWPWALVSPLSHPLEALRRSADYEWPLTVFFNGQFIKASELPIDYLPTWFAISMPELYFIAFIAALMLAMRFRTKFRSILTSDKLLKICLLVAVVAAPLLAAIALHSTIYDGLRQFLFVLPPIAALAGASAAAFLRSSVNDAVKLVVIGGVLFSAGLTAIDMVELHPYQYIYFNRLVAGGLESASTRFETDYYGASYKEGVRWLIENYHPQSKAPIRVANPSRNFLTAYYLESSPELRARFHPVEAWDNPDIFIAITRWNFHKDKDGKLLHVVSRKGVPLLYIIEVNDPSTQS